jgi:ABC-2 type transport system permease protein
VSNILGQVAAVARRSVIRTARQPAAVVFPLAFPMLLLLVNSGGLEASTKLRGFPTDSFVAFALAVPFIQGALFSTMNAGTDLARDIQTGFLNRLSLTSMRGVALIAGLLAGAVVLGLIQASFYVAVGLIVGVDFASGVLGILVLLAFSALISISFGALGLFLALRTGSGEAIQGVFPLLFVFLFLSSMNTPRDLIAVDWFKTVATANPVSYLIECVRSLIITGWDREALFLGFGLAITIGIASTTIATLALKERLVRT